MKKQAKKPRVVWVVYDDYGCPIREAAVHGNRRHALEYVKFLAEGYGIRGYTVKKFIEAKRGK